MLAFIVKFKKWWW